MLCAKFGGYNNLLTEQTMVKARYANYTEVPMLMMTTRIVPATM